LVKVSLTLFFRDTNSNKILHKPKEIVYFFHYDEVRSYNFIYLKSQNLINNDIQNVFIVFI